MILNILFIITNILLIYITYKNIFKSHYELNYHIKYYHQSLIKIKYENEYIREIKKENDNIFKYQYKKNFKILILL